MKALVVAGGISQAALIEELKSRGIYTILADKNPKAYAVKYADAFYPVSTLDTEGIKKLAIDEKVDLVITACADQVLLVVAKVSEELGLPCYIDYKTATLVSDKKYMKAVFEENNVPTAKHTVMQTFDEEKVKDFTYPLIVKPVDSYSSRGVYKVESLEALKEAFPKSVAFSRGNNAIVEEFCEGIELTVDVWVDGGRAHVLSTSVSDKLDIKDRFILYRTKNPAPISEKIAEKVKEIAQQIADAFHLVDSPMLIQMITDGVRVNVLEFCARTGGCIKYRIIKKASGFDVIRGVVDITLGKKVHVEEIKSENKYITNTFLYCNPGIFDRFEGFDELLSEGIISDYCQFVASGTEFDSITCSGDRVGSFTVQDDSLDALREKSALVMKKIAVLDRDGHDMLRHDLVTDLIY